MRFYHCYFIQKDGGIAAWRAFESECDGEAHDHALGLLVGYPHANKVEVWDSSRQTLNYSRSAAQSPAELRRLCYLAIAAANKEPDLKIKQLIASRATMMAQEAEALERQANGESRASPPELASVVRRIDGRNVDRSKEQE